MGENLQVDVQGNYFGKGKLVAALGEATLGV